MLKGFFIGVGVGVAVGLAGFFLAHIPKTSGMGEVMFYLVPTCAGFAIALVNDRRDTTVAASLIAVLCTLVILVATGREGLLCAVLAFSLLAFGLALGATLGWLVRRLLRRSRHQTSGTAAMFLLMPLIIVGAHLVELSSLNLTRREVVSNSIFLQAKAEVVWAQIQSIDSIQGPKPFLMHVGLPIPIRCALERPGLGAKRTCYFEKGYIEETITAWNPPYSMGLSIDRTNMPGRHWLGFENASYELRAQGTGTLLTRTTTITSHLYPVWYWRYFERLGVASEHEYLLNDLASRMNR